MLNLISEPSLCCSSVVLTPQVASVSTGQSRINRSLLGGSGQGVLSPTHTPDTASWGGDCCSQRPSLTVAGPQGAVQQAHFENDSRVVEIRNNTILPAELQSSSPYK